MSHPASRNENAVRAVLAFETCAGAVVGREWPSCGGGVGRASAVSELTERVRVFFFNHEPRAFHYQYQAHETESQPHKLAAQTKNSSDVERLTEGTVLDTNQRSEADTDGQVETSRRPG